MKASSPLKTIYSDENVADIRLKGFERIPFLICFSQTYKVVAFYDAYQQSREGLSMIRKLTERLNIPAEVLIQAY